MFHRKLRCCEKWPPVRRRTQVMVIPLPSPATTAGAISRATRRAGPFFVRGGVTRRLFGTTKSRSSRLASRKKAAPARPRMKRQQTLECPVGQRLRPVTVFLRLYLPIGKRAPQRLNAAGVASAVFQRTAQAAHGIPHGADAQWHGQAGDEVTVGDQPDGLGRFRQVFGQPHQVITDGRHR